MNAKYRLGYAGNNMELRAQHVFTGRTTRVRTAQQRGTEYLIALARRNLQDLLKILVWNEAHEIRFYRVSSNICPHITNPDLCNDPSNWRELAYSLGNFRRELRAISEFAHKHAHRLTFHPDPFISLGSQDPAVLIRNRRELYFHARILNMLELDDNSIVCVHGGGVYGNKPETMQRWVANFLRLPRAIRRRLAIENDEFSYSANDVLEISQRVQQRNANELPVILDFFHYACYQQTARNKNAAPQDTLHALIPQIAASWRNRRPKVHVSEQRPHAIRGAHSDYVAKLPAEIAIYPGKLDIMIEAKCKELAVLQLVPQLP